MDLRDIRDLKDASINKGKRGIKHIVFGRTGLLLGFILLQVLEGVMGLYDGLGGIYEQGSSYHLAKVTQTPIILVVDAKSPSALSSKKSCTVVFSSVKNVSRFLDGTPSTFL